MAKKKANPAIETVETAPVTGYRRAPRYRDFKLPSAEEGAEPLRVTVQSNLSFGQKGDISARGTFQDLFEQIAPYVIEWNYTALNHKTGLIEAVPPPAEGGPDALAVLDEAEVIWLAGVVKSGHLPQSEDDVETQKNDFGPSESGPDAPNSPDSGTT